MDSAGNAYVTGATSSNDFPTVNALQPQLNGVTDAFVAALDPTGATLIYSTYLGGSGSAATGSSAGQGIAVDSAGNVYVTGITTSTDFPTSNPLQTTNQGGWDAFVGKIGGGTLRLLRFST